METHHHNADPAKGKVCSHLLTDEVKIGFGIVSRRTTKCLGGEVETRPGLSPSETRAAIAGEARIRTCTVHPSDPRPAFRQSEASRLAAIAFAESILRPEDRR